MIIKDVTQGTTEWKMMRLGKISGTRLKDVMGTALARENLLNELIAEEVTEQYEEIYITPEMQRGTEEEEFAIRAYEERTGIDTKEIGLAVHDEYDWLVLSPDRFAKRNTHAVEVKCPKTKTQISYLRQGVVPKEYMSQVIHYFIVNEKLKTLDFISFDPRIKMKDLQLNIVSLKREDLQDQIDSAWESLLSFREKWLGELERLTF